MGLLSKGLSKAALEQLRVIVREEARAEIDRILNPTFIAAVTKGRDDLERMLDVVIGFEDELKALKESVRVLEQILARS